MSAKSAKKSETKRRRHRMKVASICFPIPLYDGLCEDADANAITFSELVRQIARKHLEEVAARTAATQIK